MTPRNHEIISGLKERQTNASSERSRNVKSTSTIRLNQAKSLKGCKLDCLDGEFGKVKEFYHDDRHWTIRYLFANPGAGLPGRPVLSSPYALVATTKAEPRKQK